MKKILKSAGIIAFLLIIGLGVMTCGDPGGIPRPGNKSVVDEALLGMVVLPDSTMIIVYRDGTGFVGDHACTFNGRNGELSVIDTVTGEAIVIHYTVTVNPNGTKAVEYSDLEVIIGDPGNLLKNAYEALVNQGPVVSEDVFNEPDVERPPSNGFLDLGPVFGPDARETDRFWAIAAGKGHYVAVGGWLENNTKAVKYSSNGINWLDADGDFDREVRTVGYGGGRFIAVDVGNFSPTNAGPPAPVHTPSNYVSSKAFYSTDDGITWTGPVDTHLRSVLGIVYGKPEGVDTWLLLAQDGMMAYSEDGGENWTQIPEEQALFAPNINEGFPGKLPGEDTGIRGGVYADGTWVVVGDRGVTAWSTDLTNWNKVQATGAGITWATTQNLQKVICVDGTLHAVGTDSRYFTSTDNGHTWNIDSRYVTMTGFNNQPIYNIAYGYGYFIIVGAGGRVAYAAKDAGNFYDLLSTTETGFSATTQIFGLACGGGKWLIGGRYGKIAVATIGN